jgi:uncharacterized protein
VKWRPGQGGGQVDDRRSALGVRRALPVGGGLGGIIVVVIVLLLGGGGSGYDFGDAFQRVPA